MIIFLNKYFKNKLIMDADIKSSITSKGYVNKILAEETLNFNMDNLLESDNNINIENESKVNSMNRAKEILEKLLKDSLDKRLKICEKNSTNHLQIIKSTMDTTKSISNLVSKMNKQVQEKIKKDKEKQLKLKGGRNTGKKGISPYKFNHTTRNNFYRAKTPSQLTRIRNSKTPTNGLKKELMKSKSNFMSIVKNQKLTIQTDKQTRKSNPKVKSISKKRKSSINFSKYNNDSNLEELKTISVTSIKTNKTNTTTLNTISNSRINNKFFENKSNNRLKKQKFEIKKINLGKLKVTKGRKISGQKSNNNNCSMNTSEKNLINMSSKKSSNANVSLAIDDKKGKRKKTPFKNKKNNNNIDNRSSNTNTSINVKKERTVEDEIDDILSMELSLQKEIDINNNDPLLILPIKDLDFVTNGLLRRYSIRTKYKDKNYNIASFNIIQNLDKIKFKKIFKYLTLDELVSVKNISKEFHRLIILYFIEYLEIEKLNVLKLKDNLNIKDIPIRNGIENITLSKGSKKAKELLNESLLNHLFKDNKIPSDDIILIYRIYFQMINHPFALLAKTDIDKFWEKCRLYFTNEKNGKTGDILMAMINDKKIEINGNNLYQIYNLVKGNLNKIIPNYFSDICGTTGLFVFIIKDVLDFLGISLKNKNRENSYWTYSDILDSINEKIEYLKKYKV